MTDHSLLINFPAVFYPLLKCYARVALRLYCPYLLINQPEMLQCKGPVLFAANHPNSFLDGIILTTLMDHRLYALARGDAFQAPHINRLLRRLQLLPVYRSSEGAGNLEHNYSTFRDCIAAFRQDSLVLIFSEGRCENEWHLRPLKKGTARLAFSAWQQNIPLTVIPLAFNYSSFKSFGKELHLSFGSPIHYADIDNSASEGKQNLQFNALLETQLAGSVYEIAPGDKPAWRRYFFRHKGPRFWLMLLPAALGWLLHLPLLALCTAATQWKFARSGHYDSVQTALVVLLYPLYVLLLAALAFTLQPWWALALPLLSYATALMWVRVKVMLR